MPSIDQIFLSAPLGFVNGCFQLNYLSDQSQNSEAIKRDLKNLIKESWNIVVKKQENSFLFNDDSSSALILNKYNEEKKVLMFIIRSMSNANPKPSLSQTAKSLVSSTTLSQQTVENILLEIKELSSQDKNEESNEAIKNIIKSNGKLKNFTWKIGVALSGSNSLSLNHPYVGIKYEVITGEGETKSYSSELTFAQFKEFSDTFHQVHNAMSSM